MIDFNDFDWEEEEPTLDGYVYDYKGILREMRDVVYCEYDKAWCSKGEVVWIDSLGFYTTLDDKF